MLNQNLFKMMGLYQGHPATVFCKISVLRKPKLPNIFHSLRKAKTF